MPLDFHTIINILRDRASPWPGLSPSTHTERSRVETDEVKIMLSVPVTNRLWSERHAKRADGFAVFVFLAELGQILG